MNIQTLNVLGTFLGTLSKRRESRKLPRIETRPKANKRGQEQKTRVYPKYYVTLLAIKKNASKKINNNMRQMQSSRGKYVNLWLGLGQQKQQRRTKTKADISLTSESLAHTHTCTHADRHTHTSAQTENEVIANPVCNARVNILT